MRLISCAKLTRYRVRTRSSRVGCGGTKLVTQGDRRIDARSTPRRKSCRKDVTDGKSEGSNRNDHWMVALDAPELARQHAASCQCGRYTDHQTESDLCQCSAQHQGKDIPAVGTERHADSDLVGSSLDGISRYPVNSNASQDERESAKELRKPRDLHFPLRREWISVLSAQLHLPRRNHQDL